MTAYGLSDEQAATLDRLSQTAELMIVRARSDDRCRRPRVRRRSLLEVLRGWLVAPELDYDAGRALHAVRGGVLPWERLSPAGRWRFAVEATPRHRR